MVRAWHIFDASLQDESTGHHFMEALLLARELIRRGREVHVYGHANAGRSPFPVPIARLFRHNPYDILVDDELCGELEDFLLGNAAFAEDLGRVDRRRFRHDDIVLFPTVTYNEFLAICQWTDSFGRDAPFSAAVVFHWEPYRAQLSRRVSSPATYYRHVWKMAPPALRSRISLLTTTQQIADMFEPVLGERPRLRPLLNGMTERPADPRRSAEGGVTVACLGAARWEKGFDLLPEIVGLTSGIPALRFLMQAPLEGPAAPEMQALLAAHPERVSILAPFLSAHEFETALLASDLILLLHRPERYQARLSGIYAEAALAGKPVIAAAGDTIAEEVEQHGNGILFHEYSAAGAARALAEAAGTLDGLRECARRHAAVLTRSHGPGAVIDLIEARRS